MWPKLIDSALHSQWFFGNLQNVLWKCFFATSCPKLWSVAAGGSTPKLVELRPPHRSLVVIRKPQSFPDPWARFCPRPWCLHPTHPFSKFLTLPYAFYHPLLLEPPFFASIQIKLFFVSTSFSALYGAEISWLGWSGDSQSWLHIRTTEGILTPKMCWPHPTFINSETPGGVAKQLDFEKLLGESLCYRAKNQGSTGHL